MYLIFYPNFLLLCYCTKAIYAKSLDNLAENAIRPLTISRKNFLFCGNHEAAENTAVICSLLATCKAQQVNPREWLNDVIAQLPGYLEKESGKEVKELLPNANLTRLQWESNKSQNTTTKK